MKRLLFILLLLCAQVFAVGPVIYGTGQSVFTSAGTSGTLPLPNGGSAVSADTLYIAQAYSHAGAPAFSVPSGWTQLCQQTSASTLDEQQVFYKTFANGTTPPASVVISLASGTGNIGLTSVAYQTVNLAAPFDANGTSCTNFAINQTTNVGATNVVGGAFTTTAANEMVLWCFAVNDDIGVPAITITQGTTEASVTRSGSGATLYTSIVDHAQATASSSGTNTLTWTNSVHPQFAMTIVVANAPAGATGNTSVGGNASIGGKTSI